MFKFYRIPSSVLLAALWFRLDMAAASTFPTAEEPPMCADACNKRTLYKIIWGCIATIAVCAWSSVHPNIPARESPLKTTLRRVDLMFWTVLLPEILPVWALRQRMAATKVKNLYNQRKSSSSEFVERDLGIFMSIKRYLSFTEYTDTPTKAWTRKHGHFLIMGGIHLIEPLEPSASRDGPVSIPSEAITVGENSSSRPAQAGRVTILTMDILEILVLKDDKFEIDIKEDDINDRAKSDALSKVILMLQSSSFIAQCLARMALKLHLTSLELFTLAFACLNVLTFFLWWDKPLGAQTPVRFYLKFKLTDRERVAGRKVTIESYRSAILPSIRQALQQWWGYVRQTILVGHIGNRCLACLLLVLTPLCVVPLTFIYALVCNVKDALEASSFSADARRVPTFYVPYLGSDSKTFHLLLTLVGIGTVFGGIHCLGWEIHFPTNGEQHLWRAALIFITTIPIGALFIAFTTASIVTLTKSTIQRVASETEEETKSDKAISMVFVVSMVLYGMARLALVGLALAQLRNLPSDAFLELDWDKYYPHL